VALLCFALYKQIAAIVLSPSFPGWLAPLSFSPLRFAEFANFAAMLLASWVRYSWQQRGWGSKEHISLLLFEPAVAAHTVVGAALQP
jgi:hypothetical protein